MTQSLPKNLHVSTIKAAGLGVILLFISMLLAQFITFPSNGHRVNTDAWPEEAQKIIKENPGTPITAEQWKRLYEALRPYEGPDYGQTPNWAQTIMASWWWFAFLPAATLCRLYYRQSKQTITSIALVTTPSLAALILAYSSGP